MSWTVEKRNGQVHITCGFAPQCEMCQNMGFGVQMAMFLIKFLKFDLNPEGNNPTSHALDMEMRCPACGFHEVFGVAVSKEEFDGTLEVVGKGQP